VTLTDLLQQTLSHPTRMTLARGGSVDPSIAEVLSREAAERFAGARSPQGALAGLWLFFGGWEQAHALAQDLDTPEGRYWHGIVHRQEPDAWNANYWFRQVRRHPIEARLAAEAAALAAASPAAGWIPRPDWSHAAFVDYCHQAALKPGSPAEALARQIQGCEWRLLFDYCAEGALLR